MLAKGEISLHRQFLLLTKCFLKASAADESISLKSGHNTSLLKTLWQKGKLLVFVCCRCIKLPYKRKGLNIHSIEIQTAITTSLSRFWYGLSLLLLDFVGNNFFFCHNVFKSRPLQVRQTASIKKYLPNDLICLVLVVKPIGEGHNSNYATPSFGISCARTSANFPVHASHIHDPRTGP